jgi:hypothetical protein
MTFLRRRDFLRLTGAGLGAALLAACREPLTDRQKYALLMASHLRDFDQWLDGRLGFVGEVGWPHTVDREQWDVFGRWWLEEAASYRFWVAYWASGPWPSDYELLAHEGNPLSRTHPPGRALEDASRPYPEANGVNLAGWEWNDANYPRAGSFRYLADRSVTLVRVPFAWERVQPITGGPLRDDAVRKLVSVSTWAHEAGCRVVWDCHNYEQVHHWFGGRKRLMTADEFVDLWTRISEILEGHPGVGGYSLMNEPNPHTGSDARGWEERSQACVTALRNRGDGKRVFVATFHWSNIHRVGREHPQGPWIQDTAENVAYEVHQYFDLGDGGKYPRSFDTYARLAATLGR